MKKIQDAVAEWWLRNAEIRHGHVPRTGEVQAEQPATQSSGVLPYVLGAALAAAGLGGGLLLPAAAGWLFSRDTPAVVQPAKKDGSLYQHLEDQGLHLPQ